MKRAPRGLDTPSGTVGQEVSAVKVFSEFLRSADLNSDALDKMHASLKRRKQYKRVAVAYDDKKERKEYRAKAKLVSKWRKSASSIRAACSSGRSRHLNTQKRGVGTVLNKAAEEEIVQWINSFRKEGVPVSRFMLGTKAKDVAAECGLGPDKFAATATWMKLFMRRHRFSLRTRTRQSQTTPQDALEAAQAFRELVLRTAVENDCSQIFNADQTAVFFEYVPKKTITTKGTQTVWIKCANKDKQRATVMLLGDSAGVKYDPFIIFKAHPAKSATRQLENNNLRNGFGSKVWREIKELQREYPCQIYGNNMAWWNADLSLKFPKFHFADRENRDEKVILLWDDFSAHWTQEVVDYATSLNVILLKVPPRYTYVYQPADISWTKLFKGSLRALWVERLRKQLSKYNDGEKTRKARRDNLAADILKIRQENSQQEADQQVALQRKEYVDPAFALAGPSRVDMTDWIASSWMALSSTTIISGFGRVGLLTDTRSINITTYESIDTKDLVASLEKYNLAEAEVCSDDDLGSEYGDSDG